MNEKVDEITKNFPDIDMNGSDFHEKVQSEIEVDIALMEKSIEIVTEMRMEAAELEVETASLYHSELWYELYKMEHPADKDFDDTFETLDDEDEPRNTKTA